MKERLRALREKIAPLLDPVVLRARSVLDRIGPPLRRHGRWTSYALLVPLILSLIAGFAFFSVYPANELRPWITEKLVAQLRAQSLKLGEMRWDHSLTRLSLGIKIADIEIQKGVWFDSVKVDELHLSFSPLSLVFDGTPFNIDANGLDAKLVLTTPQYEAPLPVATGGTAALHPKAQQLIDWTRKFLSYAKGYKLHLTRSKVQIGLSPDSSDVQLNEIELQADLDASWQQEIELKAMIQASAPGGEWVMAGPLKLESKSILTVRDGHVPVALDFSNFVLDLSETSFTGWNFLERLGPGPLLVRGLPRVLFREEDKQFLIGEITSGDAHAYLDDLKVDIKSRYQPGREFEFEWLVGRSEVKALHLPLKWIRRAPGAGIISSSGKLHMRDRVDNSDFTWRVSLNNFNIDSSYLGSLWGDNKSAQGPLNVSLVSEGRLANGRLESPRTEVQVDAGNVNWDPPESLFVKPIGHRAQLLLRMSHDAQGLSVSNFDVELHSLKLEGKGGMKNLLALLVDDEPAEFQLSFLTNNINLSEWSALFPSFRKVPLQGFFQMNGALSGLYSPLLEEPWSGIDWNLDKFHLSNVKGSFEKPGSMDVSGLRQDVSGPFDLSLFFVGRGQGTRVHRASLLSQLDLTGASIWLNEKFRKPRGVPLVFQVSADQSRNRVEIDKGSFRFANLDMSFSGGMVQGSGRSRLKVVLKEPIELASWKDFFPDAKIQERVRGRLWIDGSLGLDSNFQSEKDIDWSTLTFDGQTRFENFAWHSELLGNAFDSVSGTVRFSERSIDFSPVEIRQGPQTYKLEGSLRPEVATGAKARPLYLLDWFKNPTWYLQANVQVPQIELSSLLKKIESKDRYTFPDAWIDSVWAKGSRADLNLDVASISWENKELFSKLLGKLEYNKGRSTLRPFSANYKSGRVTGSATLDLAPLWARDADAQWAASLNVANLKIEDLPFPLGFAEGRVKGESTFTTQGRYFLDWENNLRMRGLLQLSALSGDTWTRSLASKVESFFTKSEASDYLISDAAKANCMPLVESALVEYQKTPQKLELARVRIGLKGGGRFDLQANVSDPTDPSASRIRGKGAYRFPTRCFSERGQRCVRELGKNIGWPMDFSASDRKWSDVGYEFDPLAYGKSFQLCMERQVSSDVQKQISAEKNTN